MASDALQEFVGGVERAHLDAPWTGQVMSHEPKSRVQPLRWRWSEIEPRDFPAHGLMDLAPGLAGMASMPAIIMAGIAV